MSKGVKIYLLGKPRLEGVDDPSALKRRKNAIPLLAYLMREKQAFERTHLATLFYPGETNEKGVKNISRDLNAIRRQHRILKDYCLVRNEWPIRFHEHDDIWLDCMEVEKQYKERTSESLKKALRLFNGPFLDDFQPTEDSLWRWLDAEQLKWHDVHIEILSYCVEHRISVPDSLSIAHRLLSKDEANSNLRRTIMLLHARQGEWQIAKQQYEHYLQEMGILDEEIQTFDPQMYQLRKRILAVQQIPNRHHNSVEPNKLIGRETEIAEIIEQLENPEFQFITITGMGGIGKTRLAMAIAHTHKNRFLEGAYFVNLSSVTNIDDFFHATANALQIDIFGNVDVRKRIEEYLQGKELLLIFDNFEQLIEKGGIEVLNSLCTNPALRFVITTREQPHLPTSHNLVLMGLNYKESEATGALDSAASALFRAHSKKHAPRVDLKLNDALNITRICEAVEGMPLAIELMARATSALSLQDIADEINRSLEIVDLGSARLKSQSVRVTFDLTWQRLSRPERDLFSRLCILEGTFSREASTNIADASPQLIRSLVDKNLLGHLGDGRYTIHPLLRHYGFVKLVGPDEGKALTQRYIHYYLNLLSINPVTDSDTIYNLNNQLVQDWSNIQKAWNLAVSSKDIKQIDRAAFGLMAHLEVVGKWQIGHRLFLDAVAGIEHKNFEGDVVHAQLSVYVGWFSTRTGDYFRGIDCLQNAIAYLVSPDDIHIDYQKRNKALSDCHWCLGLLQWSMGMYENANSSLHTSLCLSTQCQNYFGELSCLMYLEFVARSQGRYEEALSYIQRVHLLATKLNEPRAIITTGMWRCYILNLHGEYDESINQMKKWLSMAEQHNDRALNALGALVKGQIAYAQKNLSVADQMLTHCLGIVEAIGEPWMKNMARCQLAAIKFDEGEIKNSQMFYRDALCESWQIGAIPLVLECCFGVAKLGKHINDNTTTVTWLQTIIEHDATTYDLRNRAKFMLERLNKRDLAAATKSERPVELDIMVKNAMMLLPTI